PMAPADAGPQGGPLLGMPMAPVGQGSHTFTGELSGDGRDLDARPERPLLRRRSPLLFVAPLVLLLGSTLVWWFVIRVPPNEVVEETVAAAEVPAPPEPPAVVVTPEPVATPEPVVTPEPPVPVVVPPT